MFWCFHRWPSASKLQLRSGSECKKQSFPGTQQNNYFEKKKIDNSCKISARSLYRKSCNPVTSSFSSKDSHQWYFPENFLNFVRIPLDTGRKFTWIIIFQNMKSLEYFLCSNCKHFPWMNQSSPAPIKSTLLKKIKAPL